MPQANLLHLGWLQKAKSPLLTADGQKIDVWELVVDASNAGVLSAWAAHFRQHYCLDARIDALRDGTGLSRADYLRQLVFPADDTELGPAVRAGDFAEILMADMLEGAMGFWVPRTRYSMKAVRDESTKGTDVLGMKFVKQDCSPSPKDVLMVAESKAQMSGKKATARLQSAVTDSAKDALRKSYSLNAAKNMLLRDQRSEEALRVQRFQDPNDRPYLMESGAAALFTVEVFDPESIGKTDCSSHPNVANLRLIVVYAKDFMKLVHALYQRAADEA
jgi:hypothetical protein